MDVTVLERQTAALRRIYHDQSATDSDHHHQLPWNPQSDWQCDASPNPRKRKSEEFEIDEEKSDITTKTERESSANASSKESLKACEVQKPDYIHVRARRGQATDSHSLAERARREKIGKKMKCLQDLVPGCNNVTGKAGTLDEIINYVQSLQKQVEFLSMKLAAVNPSLDSFFAKEIPAYIAAQLEATSFQYNQMQQAMYQEDFLNSSCTSVGNQRSITTAEQPKISLRHQVGGYS